MKNRRTGTLLLQQSRKDVSHQNGTPSMFVLKCQHKKPCFPRCNTINLLSNSTKMRSEHTSKLLKSIKTHHNKCIRKETFLESDTGEIGRRVRDPRCADSPGGGADAESQLVSDNSGRRTTDRQLRTQPARLSGERRSFRSNTQRTQENDQILGRLFPEPTWSRFRRFTCSAPRPQRQLHRPHNSRSSHSQARHTIRFRPPHSEANITPQNSKLHTKQMRMHEVVELSWTPLVRLTQWVTIPASRRSARNSLRAALESVPLFSQGSTTAHGYLLQTLDLALLCSLQHGGF